MIHEHPLDEDAILCAICGEYASEHRDEFDWEQGPPICLSCIANEDHEAIINVGFDAAIDDMDRKTVWDSNLDSGG